MSEWPKVMYAKDYSWSTKVIPAELGQDMYEALKWYEDYHQKLSPETLKRTLERYEREVGS